VKLRGVRKRWFVGVVGGEGGVEKKGGGWMRKVDGVGRREGGGEGMRE